MHLLAHILGIDDASGPIYLFWSGPGADLSELAVFGAVAAWARKHNCAVHGCWRLGRHPVQGTPHVVCRKHHPHGALRASDL